MDKQGEIIDGTDLGKLTAERNIGHWWAARQVAWAEDRECAFLAAHPQSDAASFSQDSTR